MTPWGKSPAAHLWLNLWITPHQFAFRTNRSAEDAISAGLKSAFTHLENNTYIKLIAKFSTLGLSTTLCNWILDFLTNRPQTVQIGGHTSYTLVLNTSEIDNISLADSSYYSKKKDWHAVGLSIAWYCNIVVIATARTANKANNMLYSLTTVYNFFQLYFRIVCSLGITRGTCNTFYTLFFIAVAGLHCNY